MFVASTNEHERETNSHMKHDFTEQGLFSDPKKTLEVMEKLKASFLDILPEDMRKEAQAAIGPVIRRDLIFYTVGELAALDRAEAAFRTARQLRQPRVITAAEWYRMRPEEKAKLDPQATLIGVSLAEWSRFWESQNAVSRRLDLLEEVIGHSV